MKLLIALLLALTLCASQTPPCTLCSQIANCPKELFSDSYIDSIYNILVQQAKATGYPQELSKKVSSRQATYTFTWPSVTYIADVDLDTYKVTITVQSNVQNVINTQNQLGLRTEKTQISSSSSDANSQITKQIDADIRTKYFAGETVTVV